MAWDEDVMLMAENEKSGNGGQRAWLGTLLSYSGRCKGRMAGSLLVSILSVAAGFVPFSPLPNDRPHSGLVDAS